MMLKKLKFIISLILIVPVFNIMIFGGVAKGPSFDREIIDSPKKSKIITLSQPGHYKLIGANTNKTYSPKSNIYSVSCDNQIVIKGKGKYNIVMEDVYIDVSNIKNACPFTVESDIEAHLTLVGKNVLKNVNNDVGLNVQDKSTLTITKESGTSSLSVFGGEAGMCANNIIIKGGCITSSGDYGIYVENDIIVENGDVVAKGSNVGIISNNLELKNGKIESIIDSELYQELSTRKRDISSGDLFTAEDKMGIFSKSVVKIESGQIQVSGDENTMLLGLGGSEVGIYGGNIMISDADYGIIAGKIEMNDGNIITYGTKDVIRRGEDVEINIKGGSINGQSASNHVYFDKELTDNDLSTERTPSAMDSKIHMYIENNLLPIFALLLSVFILLIFINNRKRS